MAVLGGMRRPDEEGTVNDVRTGSVAAEADPVVDLGDADVVEAAGVIRGPSCRRM